MGRLTLNGMYQYDNTLFDGMVLPADYDRDALFMEIMNRSGQLYPYHQQPAILKSAIRLWFARNYLNFDRIMEAMTAEYNPIENYDRYEEWTRTPTLNDIESRNGTDTTARTGSDSDVHTGTNTIKDSGKDTVTNTGTDTTTRSYDDYHESITNTGSKTTEEQVSAFDSSVYEPSKKTIETPAALNEDKEISGSYEDLVDHDTEEETTYGKQETETRNFTDTTNYNNSEARTYGTTIRHDHTGKEQYENHTHGNIGVTTNMQMIEQEIELRKNDIYVDIAERFEYEFMVQVY